MVELSVVMDRFAHTTSASYTTTNKNPKYWAIGFVALDNGTAEYVELAPGTESQITPTNKWFNERIYMGLVTYSDTYSFTFKGNANEEFKAIMAFSNLRKELEKRLAKLNGEKVSAGS